MSLKADVKAELAALKADVDAVDECLHNDVFDLEQRVAQLESAAKAKVEAAVAAVENEAKKL